MAVDVDRVGIDYAAESDCGLLAFPISWEVDVLPEPMRTADRVETVVAPAFLEDVDCAPGCVVIFLRVPFHAAVEARVGAVHCGVPAVEVLALEGLDVVAVGFAFVYLLFADIFRVVG